MKTSRYQAHPLEVEKGFYKVGGEFAGVFSPEVLAAVLTSGSLSSGPSTIQLNALAVLAGITVPDYAIAAVLDVSVNDDTSGSLSLGYKGIVDATNYPGYLDKVTVQAASNVVNSKLMVVPLDESKLVDLLAVASGSGSLDYTIKLKGWIIGGAGYTYPQHPQANLKCKLVVNQ